MKSNPYLCISACLLLLIASSVSAPRGAAREPDDLVPSQCTPFNAPPKHHPVDAQCGPTGEPVSEESRKQDVAKNNLCASGTPVLVTVSTFDDLQKAAQDKGISFGNQHIPHPKPLPSDRLVLKNTERRMRVNVERDVENWISSSALVDGKKLVVFGLGFDDGAQVLLDGDKQIEHSNSPHANGHIGRLECSQVAAVAVTAFSLDRVALSYRRQTCQHSDSRQP